MFGFGVTEMKRIPQVHGRILSSLVLRHCIVEQSYKTQKACIVGGPPSREETPLHLFTSSRLLSASLI